MKRKANAATQRSLDTGMPHTVGGTTYMGKIPTYHVEAPVLGQPPVAYKLTKGIPFVNPDNFQ